MKLRFVCLYLIFIPFFSSGQSVAGLKTGYIFYWFHNPDLGHFNADYDYNHSAFSATAYGRYKVTETFFRYGIDIQYTYRSFFVDAYWGGLGGGTAGKFSYEIGNIYFHFVPQIIFGKKFRYYFFPGFFWGTILHSNLTYRTKGWVMSNPPEHHETIYSGSAKDHYASSEFGIYAGFGFEYQLNQNLVLSWENKFSTNFHNNWDVVSRYDVTIEIGAAWSFPSKSTGGTK